MGKNPIKYLEGAWPHFALQASDQNHPTLAVAIWGQLMTNKLRRQGNEAEGKVTSVAPLCAKLIRFRQKGATTHSTKMQSMRGIFRAP